MTEERRRELARLTDATADVRPSAGFADAVMLAAERELASATAKLAPAPGLTEAVMAGIGAGAVDPEAITPRSGSLARIGGGRSGAVAVALAALAAAACWLWSVRAEIAYDAEVIASVESVEVLE